MAYDTWSAPPPSHFGNPGTPAAGHGDCALHQFGRLLFHTTAASPASSARIVAPFGQHSRWQTPPPPRCAVRGSVPALPLDAPFALPRRAKEDVSAPILATAVCGEGRRGGCDGDCVVCMMLVEVRCSGGGGSGGAGALPRLSFVAGDRPVGISHGLFTVATSGGVLAALYCWA